MKHPNHQIATIGLMMAISTAKAEEEKSIDVLIEAPPEVDLNFPGGLREVKATPKHIKMKTHPKRVGKRNR